MKASPTKEAVYKGAFGKSYFSNVQKINKNNWTGWPITYLPSVSIKLSDNRLNISSFSGISCIDLP